MNHLTEELDAKSLEELRQERHPRWDPSLEEELKQWDHQVKFDVPIQMNKQVRAYLVYFSTERKEVIPRYLSRSSRYLPMIKETFQEYGLPEDMAYLAMIESGFDAKAFSGGACGMWQFIKGTGLRYGLAIDSYVDERRGPEKATRAAGQIPLGPLQAVRLLVSGRRFLQLRRRPGPAGAGPEILRILGAFRQHVPAHRNQELRAPDDCGHHHRQKPGEIRLQERPLPAAAEIRPGKGERAHFLEGGGGGGERSAGRGPGRLNPELMRGVTPPDGFPMP